MKKRHIVFTLALIIGLVATNLRGQNRSETKKIDIFNIGTISYPTDIEERSDIPFENLIDPEFRKLLNDSTDYDKLRPSLIFLKKDFDSTVLGKEKVSFGYISLTALTGTYQIPRILSDEQKKGIEENIKKNTLNNLNGTSFKITKWYPFQFTEINGLPAVQYHYEQSLKGKSKTEISATFIYDNDIQFQLVLASPKKEYKKWVSYYEEMQKSINRKINVANAITFEYPTTIQNKKDIPFKYLVDKEFSQILGDTIDYEPFRPNLLFLDRNFAIEDSLNIAPFANITLNYIPNHGDPIELIDSTTIATIENKIKQNIEGNLAGTNYKISKWNPFIATYTQGLPSLKYSYEQQLGEEEPSEIYAYYIFDKLGQIQFGMSSPKETVDEWKATYESLISSTERLLSISGVGSVLYPKDIEERNDIPFATLVDEQSKIKLGDSIDFEQFRPAHIFLKKGFDENNPSDLESFNSITINASYGDYSKICNKDSIADNIVEENTKASVIRNLSNTSYLLTKWDSFSIKNEPESRIVSYTYVQEIEGEEPKYIATTYLYTASCQITFTLTCAESDYDEWLPEYERLVKSFKPLGAR